MVNLTQAKKKKMKIGKERKRKSPAEVLKGITLVNRLE